PCPAWTSQPVSPDEPNCTPPMLPGSGGHQHGAAGGDTVTMKQVTEVAVDAGGTLAFRPGGNHMLVDLARPLVRGGTFTATLRFTSGRTLTVTVTVADNPPG
ncbi:MAG: copper chaperone PCu(A)C, partial [Microthrixaceae bacterium]